MALTQNQIVSVALVSAAILAAAFVGVKGFVSSGTSFEDGASDLDDHDLELRPTSDLDDDGLADRLEESQYGTNPNDPDTDGDGLSDGWEVQNGLNPLDSGDADASTDGSGDTISDAGLGDTNETWPNPDNGANGDPDRDGMTNLEEAALGTNPNLADTDGDRLNDKWEADYMHNVTVGSITFVLLDPLNANWECPILTSQKKQELALEYNVTRNPVYQQDWDQMKNIDGEYSCDYVLDIDRQGADGLPNYLEEFYRTNPLEEDSDGDLLSDTVEITISGETELLRHCGRPLVTPLKAQGPFAAVAAGQLAFFSQDMDGDGRFNGPADWDTDGDGMPDGYEYCYSNTFRTDSLGLNVANTSDSWGDADEDGLNNVAEFENSILWGAANHTDPFDADTDADGMPDGWESTNGIHPVDGSNGDEDPDMDGFDKDRDGQIVHGSLQGVAVVTHIGVALGDWVEQNETLFVAREVINARIVTTEIRAPVAGYIYTIAVALEDRIVSRTHVWAEIVEIEERFTNLQEYEARDRDGDGVVDGRSTNPTVADTDGDGLLDGIEVLGWDILVVVRGVKHVMVTSDPGLFDSDEDGLSDFREFNETFTNASNADTDGDGLSDYTEVVDGFNCLNRTYFTNASMFDTDNDGLEDGEEIIEGGDGFVTCGDEADTDGDGLKDGAEVLLLPRPWQSSTDPLDNDTDDDGMLDGWEMQVESLEDNTRSHSLWVMAEQWLPPGCDSMIECGRGPGGWLWLNSLQGFSSSGDRNDDGEEDPKYFISEMNLTGFSLPTNRRCDCAGRWALDPAPGTLADANYDIDNDTLLNAQEAPDRWNTNPVDNDTDGDKLPDGWEVRATERAFELGIANGTFDPTFARGPLDPAIRDSDGDGIGDGEEDPDDDGLVRTTLLNQYCPDWDDPLGFLCHIDPDTVDGAKFYDDLTNFTNYEEFLNGTDPINNDTDSDEWEDGSEVYHQDHDGDGMASGWEHYFRFDPYDGGDRSLDVDGDGVKNYCEYYWSTNPRDQKSIPGQSQQCPAE